MKKLSLAILALVVLFPLSHAIAQSSNADSSPAPKSERPNDAGRPPAVGASGGMGRQDWSTLMMLISQTIDPDEWRDFGGTGDSTMMPFPNGVWIDAQGHLKRMERRATSPMGGGSPAAHSHWLEANGMRVVSLKALNAAVSQSNRAGLMPTQQMANLAGLSHIEYVSIDAQHRDILLAGPVATDGSGIGGLTLEDLCTLLNQVTDHTQPLGCSLEPRPQGLLAAQQLINHPNTIARLSRTPQAVAEQLKQQVGPHDVRVFGINSKSATALALVDGDELMKRYGLGLSKGPVPIKNYFDHLDHSKNKQAQSLIRWWFTYSDHPVTSNLTGDLFQLPKQAVATLSQQQFIDASGQRAATGASDPAADQFAQEFTGKFSEIKQSEPAFARLEGIFEIALALQVSIDASHQTSLTEWFPDLCQESIYVGLHKQAPTSVEGVTAWDRLRNGTTVAVISGGVTLDLAQKLGRNNKKSVAYISKPTKLESQHPIDVWWWE